MKILVAGRASRQTRDASMKCTRHGPIDEPGALLKIRVNLYYKGCIIDPLLAALNRSATLRG